MPVPAGMETGGLVVGLLAGSVGLAYFVYGRKRRRVVMMWSGVGLMAYPYLLESLPLQVAAGLALTALPFFYRD